MLLFTGNPQLHINTLQKAATKQCQGEPSLQNAIDTAIQSLRSVVVMTTTTTTTTWNLFVLSSLSQIVFDIILNFTAILVMHSGFGGPTTEFCSDAYMILYINEHYMLSAYIVFSLFADICQVMLVGKSSFCLEAWHHVILEIFLTQFR